MSKRAILFDYGGVIQQTMDHTPRYRWDERLGMPHGTVERAVHNTTSWVQVQLGQMNMADYWHDVGQKLTLSDEETVKLAADFYAGDVIVQDVIEAIRTLRKDGHTVALLSNNSPDLAAIMADLGIADLFNPLIVSAEMGIMKPDAAAYEAALKQLEQPADEVVFIDDNADNITGAQALGIHAVQYTPGMNLSTALADLLTSD